MKTTSECRQPKKQRQRRKLCVYVGSFIPFVAMATLTYVDSSSLSVTLDRCLRVAGDVERRDTGFYGRWVEMCSGLKQTCTFLKQFQCCQNQQDLKFVFKDEHLNKVNAVEELKQILNRRRVVLVGDSVMREFHSGIRELLFMNSMSQNTTQLANLKYVPVSKIVTNSTSFKYYVTEEYVAKSLEGHDVIVFNQGLHYRHDQLGQAAAIFNRIGHLLHRLVHNTSKQVILRSTLPQHFIRPAGSGFYSGRVFQDIQPSCMKRVPHPVPHPSNHFLLDIARRYHFGFLDNFPIYFERGDLTLGLQPDFLDCTHHCYTPEVIWPEVVLLTQLLKEI